MNLDKFKSQMERHGLARNTRWTVSIFPPKSLNSFASSIPFDTPFGRFNLPGIDLSRIPLLEIRNARNNFPDINIGANLNLPTLGFLPVNNGTNLERINLYCQQASIPEREIKNVEWREHGQSRQLGIVHEHGKGMTLSYYCSEDLRERFFFEQWQDIIFNSQNKRRAYYSDYISTIEITKYDAGWSEQQAIYRLLEAYPTNIASQTLVYEGTALLRLDINFKFRYYERLK